MTPPRYAAHDITEDARRRRDVQPLRTPSVIALNGDAEPRPRETWKRHAEYEKERLLLTCRSRLFYSSISPVHEHAPQQRKGMRKTFADVAAPA